MQNPPRRWIRRLIITPIVFVIAAIFVILSPVIHLLALIVDLIFDRRRFRVSRFTGIALAMCVGEVFGLFTLLTVWIGSGFGLFMDRPFWIKANHVLMGQYLEMTTRATQFFLGFDFEWSTERVDRGRQLLFCRHAGPGDAFLIMRLLIRDINRRVHAVGASKLQWDPFLDISGERLRFHYLNQNPTDTNSELDQIRRLTATLEPDETFVIFPEGGNYTPDRRAAAIERLESRGRHERAEVARGLKHTLMPKTGGVCAAIEGAPDSVIVFAGHAGLENLHGLGDLWRQVPLNRKVTAHGWQTRTPHPGTDSIPALGEWLVQEWQRVDDWIHLELAEPIDLTDPADRAGPAAADQTA